MKFELHASAEYSNNDPGFQLTADDIGLLRLVYQYRYVNIDHLALLAGRSYKKIHGRLLKMTERHFLWRKTLPLQKHIYAIGKAGIPVLVEQGTAPKELLEWRLRHHELKPLFLSHIMMVTDLHVFLTLACRQTDIRLLEWQDGRQVRDKVVFEKDGRARWLTIWPDARFTLMDARRPDGQNQARFFVEADRSTSTHQRFVDKMVGYWHYLASGQYAKRYSPSKKFRVVTVTLTRERARNLCRLAEETVPIKGLKYFLFASFEDLPSGNSGAILEEIFISPKDGQPGFHHPLVGQYSI